MFEKFDTKELSETGVAMTVQRPDGLGAIKTDDGKEATITLVGRDSKTYRSAERALLKKRLESGNLGEVSDDEAETDACDMLATLTLGWENIVMNGEVVPFSKAAAKDFYVRFPWLRDQADRFVTNRANFLKPASIASASA